MILFDRALPGGPATILACALTAACGPLYQPGPREPEPPERPVTRDAGPPAEERDPDAVDVADLGPYFEGIAGGDACRALAEDRLEDAMRGFDEIAIGVEDPVLTPRARFLAAYLAQRLGDEARALEEMPQLAHQLPAIADVAWETAARSAYRLQKYDLAARMARKISSDGHLSREGRFIVADSLRRSGDLVRAMEEYRSLLEGTSGEDEEIARLGIVRCAAAAIEAGGEDEAADGGPREDGSGAGVIREALSTIEAMRAQNPLSRWTRKAARLEGDLLRAAGMEERTARASRPAALSAYDDATRHMRKKRNRKAERALNKVLKLARDGEDLWCRALYDKGLAVSRQRAHGKAGDLFARVAAECEAPNLRVKALLKGGKAFMAADRFEDAIGLFGQIEEDFAEHSYADDARLHAARCYLALGDGERFDELIASIPDAYPGGDMRAEALWTGSLEHLNDGKLDRARALLARYHELFPVEEGWYTAGRSGYWLGRVQELLGERDGAIECYERVIATAPLSHYMVMAHSRLSAMDAGRAARLMKRLAPAGGKLATTFDRSMFEEHPRLETGVELLRMGLTTKGRATLEGLIASPDVPAQVHWITAALFRRMGQFNAAAAATSSASTGWKKRYPSGEDLERWTLAYPVAFEEEVATASGESGVARALLWAVMREESGFNARVESWANAIGLMQLILPTAKAMGRRLEIKVNRRTLRQPETNIRLGAAYLSYLQKRFDSHPALVIAGYNAGEGAVDRWIEDRPDKAIDLFVENIPYKQTRGYTKRVLSTLATYTFLYEENRPVIPLKMTLP